MIEDRIRELGLVLPPALVPPGGVKFPFRSVHVVGSVAYIAGHGPQSRDGTLTAFGKVGRELDVEQGYAAARLTALSVLGSLHRALGDLNRIAVWGRVFGMVNSAPGFTRQPEVINGFSDLILDVFGPEVGAHARSAVGMAELPFGGVCVEVEGSVHLRDA
jgi:enamine deaminase RidA (YjgF/YER057c/UK114 family)